MENKCRKTDLELMKIVDDLYTELPSLSAITLIHLIENVGYELTLNRQRKQRWP